MSLHKTKLKFGISGQLLILTKFSYDFFVKNRKILSEYLDELVIGISTHFYRKLSKEVNNIESNKFHLFVIEPFEYNRDKQYEYPFSLMNAYSKYLWRCVLSCSIENVKEYCNKILDTINMGENKCYLITFKNYDISRASFTELWLWRGDIGAHFNGVDYLVNDDDLGRISQLPKVLNYECFNWPNLNAISQSSHHRKTIFVMGMHETGISMITDIISKAGIKMGKDLVVSRTKKTSDGNRSTHEDMIFTSVNDKILKQSSANEDNLNWLVGSFVKINDSFQDHCDDVKNYLMKLNELDHWAINDPRVISTYPLWYKSDQGMKFIVTLRNPLSVAYSLYYSNNIAVEEGISYWIKYYTMLIYIIELYNIDYILIQYDDLRKNVNNCCLGLFKFSGINKKITYKIIQKDIDHYEFGYKSKRYNKEIELYCKCTIKNKIDSIWDYFNKATVKLKIEKLATVSQDNNGDVMLKVYNIVDSQINIRSEYSVTVNNLIKELYKQNIDNVVFFKNKCINENEFIEKYALGNLNRQIVYNLNTNIKLNDENKYKSMGKFYLKELSYFLDCYAIQVPSRIFKIHSCFDTYNELFMIKLYSEPYGFDFAIIKTNYENAYPETTFTNRIDEFNEICLSLYENGIEIIQIKRLLETIQNYILHVKELKNYRVAIRRYYELLRNTKEFKSLVDNYIICSLIYIIWKQSFRYKKYLGSGFYFSICQILGENLVMPQLTVNKNDNKVNLEALVDKANGREIVILGQAPTLLDLDSKIMSFIKSKFVVGLNSVYFHYVPDLIMSSYLSEIIRARKALPDRTKIIHTRNIYEKPLIENIMTVRRLDFDGTLNSEFGDTPTLKTRNNIALMATSLAYILKAKNIFYMGVDLNDKGYYYDKVQKYKEMHDQSFNSKTYKYNKLVGLDHEHDNYFVAMNHNVIPDCSNIRNKHYVLNDVLHSFELYKSHLNSRGVNLYTINKGSQLNDIGINYYDNI